jgi:hypothetical protein
MCVSTLVVDESAREARDCHDIVGMQWGDAMVQDLIPTAISHFSSHVRNSVAQSWKFAIQTTQARYVGETGELCITSTVPYPRLRSSSEIFRALCYHKMKPP